MRLKILLPLFLGALLTVAVLVAVTSQGVTPQPQGDPRAGRTLAASGRADVSQPIPVDTDAPELSVSAERTPASSPAGELAAEESSTGDRVLAPNEAVIQARVDALTRKLSLSTDDAEALLGVLLQEQTRRAAAIDALRRKPDDAETRASVHRELADIEAWKTQELRTRLGSERTDVIVKRR